VADVKENPLGRRSWDRGKTVAWWVLVIGALFQGGNYLVVREQLKMAERQQDAERALRSKQHEDIMTLYETTSDQIDAVLGVLQAQAGDNVSVRPKTFRMRRIIKGLHPTPSPPPDSGGVK
jgi:hypothetical protein